MLNDASSLALFFRALAAQTPLDEADREALFALPHSLRWVDPGGYLIREGQDPGHCMILLQGFAYRHKTVADGARQIVGICLPGEVIDLHSLFFRRSDENVQALSRLRVASVPAEALSRLLEARPGIARALMRSMMAEAAVYREWMANIGRRNARARMAHFLCELALRQQAAGIGRVEAYDLPMTQEQLADLLGLTAVHVNRTLHALEAEGLIKRQRRRLSIADWKALASVGDFTPAYLNLGLAARAEVHRRYA